MPKLTLFRTESAPPSEAEKEAARHLIFGVVDGLGRDDKSGWRRFWRQVMKLEIGEVVEFDVKFPRSGPHHRLFFAMLNAIYDAQERFTDFDQFRRWLLIGAGHVDWVPGAKGGVVPLARSISYAAADEEQFSQIHRKVLEFLRGDHCAPFLWPHLGREKAHDMMETILEG